MTVIKILSDGEDVRFSLYLTDESKTIRSTQDEVKIVNCVQCETFIAAVYYYQNGPLHKSSKDTPHLFEQQNFTLRVSEKQNFNLRDYMCPPRSR